jgi:hypothetical protein
MHHPASFARWLGSSRRPPALCGPEARKEVDGKRRRRRKRGNFVQNQ